MITRFKIAKLIELTDIVTSAKDTASELLRTVQDRNNTTKHTIEREGKMITVDESVLWEEVFYLNAKGQAADILTKKYPEVFEAYQHQNKAAEDLAAFCFKELGINFREMRIADYIKLTEGMFHMMFDEMKKDLMVDLRMTLQTEDEAKKGE